MPTFERTKEVFNKNKKQFLETDMSISKNRNVYTYKNRPQAVVSERKKKKIDKKLSGKSLQMLSPEQIEQLVKDKYLTPEAQYMLKRENYKFRDYMNEKLNEITDDGVTVGEKIADRYKAYLLDADMNPNTFLKALELLLKLRGELVDKVARTDANGNDLANSILSNERLLEIMKQRDTMKQALREEVKNEVEVEIAGEIIDHENINGNSLLTNPLKDE